MVIKSFPLVYLLGLSLLWACGKDDKDHLPSPQEVQEERPNEEGLRIGSYRIILAPLNNQVFKHTSNGTGNIETLIEGIAFQINMVGTPAGVTHHQYVHDGNNCPEENHDINQDGVIDVAEVNKISGKKLMELDGDLNAKDPLDPEFPRADGSGHYTYREVMKPDSLDIDPQEKVIIIYGVPARTPLPETIETMNGLSSQDSLPIACGKILRVPEEE